jgi:aspartyl/asparaginyl-tRNA synthetase
LEEELLEFLGFGKKGSFKGGDYIDVAKSHNKKILENDDEEKLYKDHGSVFFLKNFPTYTSPFWNMKIGDNKDTANKCDVILCGQETIGSAERSCDPNVMKEMFDTISDGGYADILYKKFGKERVDKEMKEFLSHDFVPRYGGGIGVTRMIRAMKMCNLIPEEK